MTGSRPSRSGHLAQRGRPARSREEIGLVSPQPAHGSVRRSQTVQYQCRPRRCRVRSCLPHSAQTWRADRRGAGARRASSSSPTARGAGDRPSRSTPGRSARAAARRRAFARPPATAVTTAADPLRGEPVSTAPTSSTTSPIGSDSARSARAGAVTAVRRRGCGPAWDAGRRDRPRRRPPSSSVPAGLSRRRPARSARPSRSPGCRSSAMRIFRLSRSGRSTTSR